MKSRNITVMLVGLLVCASITGCGNNNSTSVNECTIEANEVFKSDLGLSFDILNDTIEYHPENCQLRFDMTIKNDLFEQLKFTIETADVDGNTECVGDDQPYLYLGSGVISDNIDNSLYVSYAINFNENCQNPNKIKCRLVFENEEKDIRIVSTYFDIDIANKTYTTAQLDTNETVYDNSESEYNILSSKLIDMGKNVETELLSVYGNEDIGFFAIDNISGNKVLKFNNGIDNIEVITEQYELTVIRSLDNYESIQYNMNDVDESFFNEYEYDGRRCTVQWYVLENGTKSAKMHLENTDGSLVTICLSSIELDKEQFKELINTMVYSYTRFKIQ